MTYDSALLATLVEFVNQTGTSLELNYSEVSSEWYAVVGSIAPAERWMSRDGSFNQVVSDTIEWLRGTMPGSQSEEFRARLAKQENRP